MSSLSKITDEIPGFLNVGFIFKGTTHTGERVSMAILVDEQVEAIVDLDNGLLSDNPRLTKRMKSYLTGLAEVGTYLKNRTTEDEDGVMPDDIERAALALAFPKVTQNPDAMDKLKAHLDLLQRHGIVEKINTRRAMPPRAAPLADGETAPQARPVVRPPRPAQPAHPSRPVSLASAGGVATGAAAGASAVRAMMNDAADKVAEDVADVEDTVSDAKDEVKDDVLPLVTALNVSDSDDMDAESTSNDTTNDADEDTTDEMSASDDTPEDDTDEVSAKDDDDVVEANAKDDDDVEEAGTEDSQSDEEAITEEAASEPTTRPAPPPRPSAAILAQAKNKTSGGLKRSFFRS